MTSVYDFSAQSLDGVDVDLSSFKGKVLLIVNTASRCGFTPQYAGLQSLYEKYQNNGLVVLGFPCNQFGAQEPGTAEDIASFCDTSYGVTFPMFAKIEVNGPGAHPLFKFLTGERKGVLGTQAIKWNFTKFLVGKDGAVIERFAPQTKPEDLAAPIKVQLQAESSA